MNIKIKIVGKMGDTFLYDLRKLIALEPRVWLITLKYSRSTVAHSTCSVKPMRMVGIVMNDDLYFLYLVMISKFFYKCNDQFYANFHFRSNCFGVCNKLLMSKELFDLNMLVLQDCDTNLQRKTAFVNCLRLWNLVYSTRCLASIICVEHHDLTYC